MGKKVLLPTLLALIPMVLSAQTTLNPATFTVSNLNSISSGTTVYLDGGVYTPDQAVLDAWASGVSGTNNVTFKPSGSDPVIIDGMSFPEQKQVRFTGCDYLRFENLTLKNIKLQFWRCNNSTFDRITSKEQKFILPNGTSAKAYGKLQSLLAIGYGNNCTISNCTLEITFSQFSCKAIKSYRGKNHKFLNNHITGNLQGAYEIWSDQNQPNNGYSGAVVRGDYIERTVTGGNEDHGIYIHDVSDALIDSCIVKGWSATAAGGAVKIKNSNNVEVKNCTFYTSGILLRTGLSGWQHCENIYIHHNDIHGDMAISTYMTPNAGYDHPHAMVFEHNKLYDDGIKMTYPADKFNQYCERAGKNGGIYTNEYNGFLNVSAGVNGLNTNCTFGSGCAEGSGSGASTSIRGNNQPQLADHLELGDAYPNPFNPSTTIQYTLKKAEKISLVIYTVNGQAIRTLVNKKQAPGHYTVTWNGQANNGQNVASGIYFYRLTGFDGITVTKKMLLAK